MIPIQNREEEWWFLFSQLGGIGPKTLHKIQEFCWQNGLHPKDLEHWDPAHFERPPAFSRSLAARLRVEPDENHPARRLLASLRDLGVQILTPRSASYPASLKLLENVRPVPLLLAAGSLDLLARPRVGLVSSRGMSGSGVRKAEVLARTVRSGGGVVVGGQSPALDSVVNPEVVLPEGGILPFLENNSTRGRVIVSPWSPDYTRRDRYATTRMQLEKTWLLLGLSSWTVVVELKTAGRLMGILERAKEIGFPIFDGNSDGNELAGWVGRA